MMTLTEIYDAYRNGDYTYKGEIIKPVPKDHIFDENLSVKRNREMVEEQHAVAKASWTKCQDESGALTRKLNEDIEAALMEEYEITAPVAALVRGYAYQQWHSCMHDMFANLPELAELAEEIQKHNRVVSQ